MEQRSTEWFAARKGRITGSKVGAILGINPYKKPADAMRDMVREWHGAEREFKGNPATEWGTANEQSATNHLEMFHLDKPVEETGFHVHPEYDWLGASPDGFIGADGVVEIKCPYGQRGKEKPEFKKLVDMPHYFAQTQIEMACTGRIWCKFYQWAPNGDAIEEHAFSQTWFDENLAKLEAFYQSYLLERELPNAQRYLDPKHKEQEDVFIADLVEEYQLLSEQIKEYDQAKRDILAEIVERCGERQSEINGHKLTKVERKGSIDYKKVPELDGIDLEQYRKKPSEYWSLK